MPYKMEDLVYPGGQPAKVDRKPSERKPSMGVLDMLENMGRTEKAKPIEEPVILSRAEPIEEPKPEPKEKPVATMPKITKQEEPKRRRFGATPETSKDLYDKEPVEEPRLDYRRFFEPKPVEPEPIVEPPKHIENEDDYNRVRWNEEKLHDEIEEYLKSRECETVKATVAEPEVKKIEKKAVTSDGAVKVSVDALKILVLAGVGLGFIALVIKGIMMLFGI